MLLYLYFLVLWDCRVQNIWGQSSAQPGARRREGCRISHYPSWTDSVKLSLLFSNFGCYISKGSPFRLFKNAFDRVWHETLWATMRKYNINASIIRATDNLYDKAQSAVLFNGSTGEWFRTTVGVRQGCLLSPTFFNIFLERIMCEALDDHVDSVSIGGRLINNFCFADDIVVNAEEELQVPWGNPL